MKEDKKIAGQKALLQYIEKEVVKLEEAKKELRASALNLMKTLKEYLVLADEDEACTDIVKGLQERLFGL